MCVCVCVCVCAVVGSSIFIFHTVASDNSAVHPSPHRHHCRQPDRETKCTVSYADRDCTTLTAPTDGTLLLLNLSESAAIAVQCLDVALAPPHAVLGFFFSMTTATVPFVVFAAVSSSLSPFRCR